MQDLSGQKYEAKIETNKNPYLNRKGLNVRIRSARIDPELNKFDNQGNVYPSPSKYNDDPDQKKKSVEKKSNIVINDSEETLRRINAKPAPEGLIFSSTKLTNVIFLNLSEQMSNFVLIPPYFKQSMILNDRIIDEEIIERMLLQNTIE